ncbi:MAG: DNA alkylation repair protein [Methanocorpusculum sp.]|nr:DNA alkylation repair protein [Methanocorpusculum sp.]
MPAPDSDLNGFIRSELCRLAEPEYGAFSSKLLPGTRGLLGVRIPALRELAKRIAKGDWKQYLADASDDSFEEVMLQGLVISYAKAPPADVCAALAAFIPKIDNWSVCDSMTMGLKIADRYPAEFWEFAQAYLDSPDEFKARFGFVLLLSHFVKPAYIDRVLERLARPSSEGYYCKMAVAWAVSVCYVKFPEKTEAFLADCPLDDWTFNKAIQKTRESYRVSDEAKERLKGMCRVKKHP